jgi:hypothetical protein
LVRLDRGAVLPERIDEPGLYEVYEIVRDDAELFPPGT